MANPDFDELLHTPTRTTDAKLYRHKKTLSSPIFYRTLRAPFA